MHITNPLIEILKASKTSLFILLQGEIKIEQKQIEPNVGTFISVILVEAEINTKNLETNTQSKTNTNCEHSYEVKKSGTQKPLEP